MKLVHIWSPKRCLDHLKINGDAEIVCDVCGRRFGFVYDMNPVRAFVFQQYLRFRPEITDFVRHKAAPPPSVDECAEAYRSFLDELHRQFSEALTENLVESEPDDEVEIVWDDYGYLDDSDVSEEGEFE